MNQTERPNQQHGRTLRRWIPLVLPLLLLVSSSDSLGQEETTKPLRIDWDTAWELALERNESLSLARAEAELSRYRVKEAYSAAMPTVELNGTLNHYFMIPGQIVTMPGELNAENPGEPFSVTFEFSQENAINGSVQLTQPLWLAGKVGLALKVAKDFESINKLGIQVSREDLRVTLLQAFYGAMIAEEYMQTSHDALAQAERYRSQVQEMFDQGVVSEYDLIRAGVAVSNLKPQVSQAEASRDLGLKALKSMIGLDLDQEIEVVGELEAGLAPPEEPFEVASQMAMKNRLELRQLELQRNLYDYQYKIEKRNLLWPNFLAGLRYETTGQAPDLDMVFSNGFSAQFIVQIPLFDGFASSNRAQQAKVNKKKVDLQLRQAERGIEVQVFQAMREYQKAAEELVAAQENILQAEKGYAIAEARYSGGVGTQIEVLDAQLQLNQSRVMLLQAKYNKLVTKAQYDRAIGTGFTLDTEE